MMKSNLVIEAPGRSLKGQVTRNQNIEKMQYLVYINCRYIQFFEKMSVKYSGTVPGIFGRIHCAVIYSPMCNNLSKIKILHIGAELQHSELNYSTRSKITALWRANYSTSECKLQHIGLQITAHWSIHFEGNCCRKLYILFWKKVILSAVSGR